MPSPSFTSISQSLIALKSYLITTGKDYDAYTAAEHAQALGFRVLASAYLEDYIERRCLEVATRGIARTKNHQPSRAGRSVVTWYCVRRDLHFPVDARESVIDERLDSALSDYRRAVRKKHGISASNVVSLVNPLGISEVDQELIDKLQDLATARGQAAHTRINRVRSMTEPEVEWTNIKAVLDLLEPLDAALDVVAENL